ncbi:hypothetical protein Tco_0194853 [Tanacetum coccineum]
MIPLTTSLCITVPKASPEMKERSTSRSYHVSSMKVALSTPPSLMINPTVTLLSRLFDSSLIRDALFNERTQPKTQKMKGVDTTLDPFQMIVSELKTHLKKWEIILRMLLTWLFEHVRVNHPYSFSNELYLMDYMMIPLSEKKVFRFKDKGKRPRLPTPTPLDTESSDSPSPTPHQGVENDPVNNYTLDPIPYMNQLPPIEGGDSSEFKQTKRMFKCLFHFLFKKK